MITPMPIAIVGSQPPPFPGDPGGGGELAERRRRGGVDIEARVPRARQEASHIPAKAHSP